MVRVTKRRSRADIEDEAANGILEVCVFFVKVRVSFILGNWNDFDYTTSSDIDIVI